MILAVCLLVVISASLRFDGVEVVVQTPDVHHLAVAADRRGRVHITTGWKAPDLAAGHCIDGVEVLVETPDVHHLAVAADRRGRLHPITGWEAPELAARPWPSGGVGHACK